MINHLICRIKQDIRNPKYHNIYINKYIGDVNIINFKALKFNITYNKFILLCNYDIIIEIDFNTLVSTQH